MFSNESKKSEMTDKRNDKKKKLMEKLYVMQRKEEELKSLIESVDISLRDMGYPIEICRKDVVSVQTGIRIRDALSFRGKQKAEEYFDYLDTDNDGFLNFEDFRAMKSFDCENGIVHNPEYLNSESWRLFIEDKQLKCNEHGGMDKYNFVKFREQIELKQPLTKELEYVNLGYLPKRQQEWIRYKELLKEIDEFREFKKTPAQKLLKTHEEIEYTFEELEYVLCNNNMCYTRPEIARVMYQHRKKYTLMNSIIRKYSKRNLSQQEYNFVLNHDETALEMDENPEHIKMHVDDFQKISKKYFIPWVIAAPVLIDNNEIYRQLIRAKYVFLRYLRKIEDGTRYLFQFAAHMNDRLIFRDYLPLHKVPKSIMDLSTLKYGISIGDESNRDGGISGNWKLIKMDTPELVYKKLKMPTDTGFAIVIDLLYHMNLTEAEIIKCSETLRQYLSYHFEKEFRNNPQFSGIYVYPAVNESDGSKVLRICLSYKRVANLDHFFEHMLIPYKFMDMINVCVGDFRSNIDLHNWKTNKVNNLEETFACSLDITIGLRRQLVINIIDRIILALSAGVTKAQSELDREEIEENMKKISENDSMDEINRRLLRWNLIRWKFPMICGICEYMSSSLKCMKTALVKYKYSSISEFVYKLKASNHWLSPYLPTEQALYTTGYIRDWYHTIVEKYSKEFHTKINQLKTYLEQRKEDEHIKRLNKLIAIDNNNHKDTTGGGGDPDEKEREITMERLRRLGIEGNDALFQAEISDPKQFIEASQEENNKRDILGFLTIEHLQKCLISIHSIELLSGKTRLSLSIQGLDIFELIPLLPSMQKIFDDNQIGKKH